MRQAGVLQHDRAIGNAGTAIKERLVARMARRAAVNLIYHQHDVILIAIGAQLDDLLSLPGDLAFFPKLAARTGLINGRCRF